MQYHHKSSGGQQSNHTRTQRVNMGACMVLRCIVGSEYYAPRVTQYRHGPIPSRKHSNRNRRVCKAWGISAFWVDRGPWLLWPSGMRYCHRNPLLRGEHSVLNLVQVCKDGGMHVFFRVNRRFRYPCSTHIRNSR